MEIVFKKDDGDERKYHKCNICGYVGVWDKNWRWTEIPMGEGYSAYEIGWRMCSDECIKKTKELKPENINLREWKESQ